MASGVAWEMSHTPKCAGTSTLESRRENFKLWNGSTCPVDNSLQPRPLPLSTKLLAVYGRAGTRSSRSSQDLRQSPLPIGIST